MNDRPGQDELEAPLNEATAALWRHHFRAYQTPAPFAEDDDRTLVFHITNGSARIGPAEVTSYDPGASQRMAERSPTAPPRESEIRRPDRSGRTFAHTRGLLLIAILTVQAVLSLRLVWSNTAFPNEAVDLFGGHVELAHWLHGTALPPFATSFPGAPVIYPPLGALAASIGGLAAARLLSLAFMLGATGLLWGTTSKLFGGRAAFFAAALFAVVGPTQALGALATYDAMALFLLAASAWCVVSAEDRDNSTRLLVAGMLLLALANATKYATAVLDPAVVALAAITVMRRRGLKPGFVRSGQIAACTLSLVCALLALGGHWYLTGVLSTTVSRAAGSTPASVVLLDAAKWCGLVCAIAGLGVICALRPHDRSQLLIVTILTVSATLVPLDQARIHTTTSLFKQVDFGVWFAAAAAGFALAQLFGVGQRMWLRAGATSLAGMLAVVLAGTAGLTQAGHFFQEWPNSTQETMVLRSLTRTHPGNYLAEDYAVPAFYLENSIPWQRWSQTGTFTFTPADGHLLLTGNAAYQAAIDDGYFSLIVLGFADTAGADQEIVADMRQAGTYQLIADVPTQDGSGSGQVTVWAHEAPRAAREGNHGHG
jgi:hypothetical protein